MSMKTIIKVHKLLNDYDCLSREQGDILCSAIMDNINDGNIVEVNFSGIKAITTAFLSSGFGSLLVCQPAVSMVKEQVKVTNMSNFSRVTLNKIMKIKVEEIVQENICGNCPYVSCPHHPKV